MSGKDDELIKIKHELRFLQSYLRTELGYDLDNPGNIGRRIKEIVDRVDGLVDTVRGADNELGLVGRVNVLWRTWIVLTWGAGTLCGYALRWAFEL